MSKKGLSMDEKKGRMLKLLHDKKTFFQLKELEKIAPVEKGITTNTVKDVIQALVDDEAIDTDKIGSSVYYWSYPSKSVNNKKRKLEELRGEYENDSKKLKLMKETASNTKLSPEEIEESRKVMGEVNELIQRKNEVLLKLQALKEADPAIVIKMKQDTEAIKEAANRWTDNIFAIKSWCKKKFLIEDKVLNKQFGIREDLDYLD